MKTPEPCPQCLELYDAESLRGDAVQPMPERPALSRRSKRRICSHCGLAEGLADRMGILTDAMARVAVANEFQEALRMPKGFSAVTGLRLFPNVSADDLESYYEWLTAVGLWPRDGEVEPRRLPKDARRKN